MTGQKDMKQISGEIPTTLAEAFTEAIEALGLVKKRAIAAAIAAWLRADSQTQMAQYHEVFELFYLGSARPADAPTSTLGEDAAKALAVGKKRRARRGA